AHLRRHEGHRDAVEGAAALGGRTIAREAELGRQHPLRQVEDRQGHAGVGHLRLLVGGPEDQRDRRAHERQADRRERAHARRLDRLRELDLDGGQRVDVDVPEARARQRDRSRRRRGQHFGGDAVGTDGRGGDDLAQQLVLVHRAQGRRGAQAHLTIRGEALVSREVTVGVHDEHEGVVADELGRAREADRALRAGEALAVRNAIAVEVDGARDGLAVDVELDPALEQQPTRCVGVDAGVRAATDERATGDRSRLAGGRIERQHRDRTDQARVGLT
ncbi:MAG: hypothetical protein ACK55I_13460, partial [bacterium]